MNPTLMPEIRKSAASVGRKAILTSGLAFLLLLRIFAQPGWVAGTPTVNPVAALSCTYNYGITGATAGTVYVIIYNSNVMGPFTSAFVKTQALAGPSGGKVVAIALPVAAGQLGSTLQQVFELFAVNQPHAMFCVAENGGGLQAAPVRIPFTTAACPPISFLNALIQPVSCVNKTAQATFAVSPDPDPMVSGILKGTTWAINWGDGTTANYTSTADNDIPPLAMRRHTYSTVTSCNYVFTCGIKNPCGNTYSPQYVAVVHGRDIPSDGDGILQIVNAANGSTTIQVCEGVQTIVQLRDNSTWNCQNPTVPGGLTAVPNLDPRNIEWTYGRDPAGAITNTITGTVAISNLGNAPQVSGRISPNPYGPSSLSESITIPATCVAGQYFRVYLKNWNKCNWTDPEYVNTFVDILVVAAPPRPTVPNVTICNGGATTLTVTSPAVGTLYWYSDATLLTQVATGPTYAPPVSAAGTYNYWVVDQSLAGLQCRSQSRQTTLTIREALSQPGAITGPAEVCLNATGQVFSVVANPPVLPIGGATEYLWTVPAGWTITAGQGTRQITVDIGGSAGSQTVSVVNRYTTLPNCPSTARTLAVTVSPLSVGGSITGGTTPLCTGSATGTMTLSGHTGSILRWEKRLNAGAWSNIAITTTTYSETPSSVGTWEYRALLQSGSCASIYSGIRTIVVVPASVGGTTSGGTTPICLGSGTGNISIAGYTGAIVIWQQRIDAGGWNNIVGTAGQVTISQTPATAGTYDYRVQVQSAPCASAFSTITTIVVNPLTVGGAVGGGTTPLCVGSSTGAMTLAGHTGSVLRWQRRLNAGAWVDIVNTTTTHTETPASVGTWEYRAEVQSGACAAVFSTARTIVVDPTSVGGAVGGGSTPICQGSGTGVMTLAGHTGSITKWQKRVNAGAWTDIVNTITTYSETPTGAGTWEYRAEVKSGACPAVFSTPRTIVVDPTTVAGAVGGGTTPLCLGSGTGVMTLAGQTGAVLRWQKRVDAGAWADIANVTATYSETPASAGTWEYRAEVKSGTCAALFSTARTIVVDPTTVGGSVTGGSTPICYNVNTGVMTLSGHTGAIQRWEKRVDAGAWSNIANTTTTYSEVPSSSGTWEYRALLQSGSCPSQYSAVRTIVVRPRFQLAQLMDDASICSGGNIDFNIVMTGGVGPYTVNYTKNGVPQAALNNYNSGTNVNTGPLAATTVYALTSATDANGCPVESLGTGITITVGSLPTSATLTGSGDACFGATSTIRSVITGGAPPYTIKYTRNGVAQADITNYTSGSNYTVSPLAVGSYTYIITQVTDNCGNNVPALGLPPSYPININGIPDIAATNPASQTICSNTAASINLISTVNNTIFNYTVASVPAVGYSWSPGKDPVNGTITDGDGNGTEILSRTLQHNYNAAVTVTYTITPVGPGATACPGAAITRTVIVNPVPAITNMTATICSGGTFTSTPANGANGVVPAGTTYTWAAPVIAPLGAITGGSAQGTGQPNISQTLTNITNASATATYTVTPVTGSCTGATFTVTVTVDPVPAISAKTATICSASAFNVSPVNGGVEIVPAGTTYTWTAPVIAPLGAITGGSAQAVGQPSVTQTLTNTTNAVATATYTVTPRSGSCTGATFQITVTVDPKPAISNKTTTICSATAFTVSPVNGGAEIVPAGTTFTWGIPVIAPLGAITGGSAQAVGQPNISQTLTNTTNAAATATYTVTPTAGGCSGSTFTVTVTVSPVAAIAAKASTICSGTAFTVAPVNGGAEIVPAGTTYTWGAPVIAPLGSITGGSAQAVGQPNISQTLTNTTNAAATATYTVTPRSGSCDGPTFQIVVTVNPRPAISNKTATICSATAFTVAPVNGGAEIVPVGTTYTWGVPVIAPLGSITGGSAQAVGQPNISQTLTNTTAAPATATYTVTPLAGSCAGSTFTVTVTVNPTPLLSTTLTPADVCSNTVFTYNPASATAGTTFNWSRATVPGITPAGPTSGTNNPNEILRNITSAPIVVTYQYTLAANSCSNVQNVVVNIKPEPVITAGQTTAACSGNALSYKILMDNFTNPGDNVTFTWPAPVLNPVNPGFTGGSARVAPSSANITDTYTNTIGAIGTATYTITPYKNGCAGAPVTLVVTVGAEPVLDPALNRFACSNIATGLLLKEATGSVVPSHYNITAVNIQAGLTPNGANAVIPNAVSPANYLSGDRFLNTTGVNKTVTYTVQPVLAPDCFGDPVDVVVTVRPQPVILPAQTKTVCSGVAIGKEVMLVPANTPAGTVFNWSAPVMSDASVQGTAGVNVAADPAGTIHINDQINNYSIAPITATYTITPTSSFGCSGDPIPVVITIKPEPIPKPISGRDKICVTDKNIVYNVNPEAGSTFTWTVPATVGTKTFDFNTNAILIDAAAVAGSGNITVYETNSFGCAGDPSSLAVQVFTQAAPENVVGPALVCANSTQVYSVTNRAGSLYTWTIPGGAAIIGDPSASSITIVYANVGGTILVRETNAAGCITNHNPFAVNVSALPTATISGTTTICDGASANLTVDFTGTGPYTFTYALNGVPQAPVVTAADPYTLNVTASGTYTVVNVTDATTCTNVGAGSAVVSYFPKPTGIISGTTAICQGNSATLTVTLTGTAPYTFTYTDGITPVTVTNHPTAVYTASVSPVADKSYTLVSLTDGNSCTGVISGSADITVNIPPVLTLTPTNLTCYNDNTGSVNLGVVGNAPFGYSWTGPDLFTANTEDISGLKAGIYTVVVTDTKGCTRTGNVTVNQPPQLTASAAITSSYNGANISCFGASDAVITVTAAGGTGAKTYQIIEQPANVTGAASGVFTGVGPGTVTVKVTDASGCTVNTAPLTVTQPAAVTAVAAITSNYSGSHISCFGANDARITVTASGGTGALSYVLNEEPANVTGATTGLFTGVGPGSKTVTVKDINNCTVITVPVVVVEPAIVNGTSSVTSNYNGSEVSCFGATDGIITATSSGGTGTRSYQIIEQPGNLTGATTGVFTGLSAGTYTVRIRDANNCTFVTPSVIIDNPVAVSASLAITSNYNGARVSCFGASDGIITATAAGGTGALVYVLDQNPANVTGAASGVFTGLPAGVYSVTVTDLNSCSKTTNSVTIVNPTAVSATAAVTSNYNGSQISCNGASDGRITVTATGGTGALSYLLVELPGNVTGAASGVFTGLPANTYTVRVRDLNNCEVITVPVTVSQPLAITATSAITSNYNGSHISCNGASDGRITVTAGGGTGLLTYVLNEIPANVSGLNTGIFTGLPAGPYTVTVTDKNSCSVVTVPVTIVAPAAVSVVASVTSNYNGSEVSCNGASDGIITAVGAGGTGALSYSLVQMPGNLTGTASGVFTGVPAGTYTVRITDVNNCTTLSANVVVDNPPALTATGSVTSNYNGSHVTCNGAADGVITITSGGGTGARVHVLDQNPANVTGAATGIFTGLTAGTYTVTVTDANGCTKTTPNITVNNPPAVTATAAVTSNYNGSQISCNGASDGRITVTASGGTGALSYLLVELPGNVTGAASGVFTGLPANTYTVRVRDVNNCEVITLPVTISNPPVLTATASVTSNYFGSQLSCNGASDGRITVVTAGGTGAPSYVLNELPANVTGAISGVFTGLPANTYTVTVTDKNGCTTVTAPVTITPPPALGITVNITSNYNGRDISCFGASDGRAEAVVTGGTGGYTYIWYSDPAMTIPIGQLTSLAINLAAGDYFVKVTDANGCMISGSVILAQPTALDAAITAQTNVACFGALTGAVTVTATAGTGTAPYEYSINGGSTWQPAGTFSSLAANNYTVLVKDVNGCIKVVPVAITQPAQLVVAVSSVTNVSCNGGNDGSVTVTVTAGTGVAPYQYSINGGPFQASATFGGLIAGTYNITARDANLCTQTVPVVITEPIVLQMTKTPDVLLNCFGDMTGLGTFFATGGTLPYTFAVVSNTTGGTVPAPGFNSQAFFTAGAGSITVRVTDAKGCSVQATINITQPALLTPGSIGSNQVICATSNPAMLTELTPSTGGPAAPVYQWQYSMAPGGPFMNIAGANGVTYTPPAAATTTFYYRRMVTSGLCLPVYSNEVEVLVNARPVGILTGGATICPGESTILKVNLPIGTGPFEIDLENYPGLTITGYTSDADITVTPAATTTYKVLRIRDANGCEVVNPSANIIGTALVTVRALPAITVQPVSKVVCEFGMTTYAITATGSDLTYQWFVDEGSGFIPVIDGGIYFGSGTPSLMIFGTNRLMNGFVYQARVTGCSTTVSSANATLTVNTAPEIINQPQDSTICSTQNASFAVNVQGTALVYQWQVNKGAGFVSVTDDVNFSGSNSATLNITNAPGSFNNYIFRVRISGTCGVPLFSNIVILRVNVPPTVALNPVNKAICANGGPVYFIANGSGMIDSLRWQVFSGGVWSDIYDDAVYSGTTSQQLTMVNVPLAYNGYQYRLGLKAFCATTYTNPATLTVNANPVVNFAAPLNACGGVPLVLNGNPSGGSGSYNQHIWTGDVGPLNNYFVQSPTFTSQIAGTYNLNYKVRDTNGCYADDDLQVIVDAPDASFAQDMLLGCTPLTVNFTKDMTGISKFWWTFGDGSPKDSVNANPTHIFTNVTAGSIEYREVELKVRSAGGCFDTYKSTVTVYPEVDASFTPNTLVVCSGQSITFTALSGASKYFWEFGDGANGFASNVTSHLYTNLTTAPVVQTVRLTTTSFYNCTDVQTVNITVMPVPLPQFTAAPPTQNFVNPPAQNNVVFTNMTNAGTWNWLWKFGDGGTSNAQAPTHTYTGVGNYTVTLVVSNANCSDSVKHPVTILPIAPVASFDTIPYGCAPHAVNINNTSLNTAVPGTTYFWDFGDGNTSTLKNPNYVYVTSGDFVIKLVVQGPGGMSVAQRRVSVYPTPKAYFEVTPTNVFINDERVRMFNLSSGADYFIWQFGDGDTSKVRDPFHKYTEEGVFDITLTAYSVNGCFDSFTLSPGVTVEPAGDLRFSTVFSPNKEGPIEVDKLPTGGEAIDQFFFPPIREKVLNYKLQIFNRWGTLIFESRDINRPWNGYYKGKLCKQGVYVWYVEGKYGNGAPFKKTGDITLLH